MVYKQKYTTIVIKNPVNVLSVMLIFPFKVLDLEQMLTTGGGWQDQVGGLCPGVKIATSKNQLPLEIVVQQINLPEGFLEKLEKHLLVVFTGKTRLARNMLQVSKQ